MEKILPKTEAVGELSLVHVVGGLHILGKSRTYNHEEFGVVVEVDKPFQLITVRHPVSGQPMNGIIEAYGSLGLFPPFEKVVFQYAHVLHVVKEIPKVLSDNYLNATTGIQLASA